MYDASSASTTPVNTAMKSAIGIDATPRRAIWVTTCGAQASTSEIALVAARVFAPMPVTNLEKGDADVTKSRASAREARQRATGVAFLEPLQGPISELAHSLTGHAEHLADLLERVLATAVEAEVQSQHSRVARRQRGQRLLASLGLLPRELLGPGARPGRLAVGNVVLVTAGGSGGLVVSWSIGGRCELVRLRFVRASGCGMVQ